MPTDELHYPTINSYRYSWASLKFKLPKGMSQPGVKDISYKLTIDRGKARGAGRHILGLTAGNVDYSGSITILADEWMNLINDLGDGYMDYVFPTTVRYQEGKRIHEVVIHGCRFGEEDLSHAQGTDALEVKIKLDYIYYLIDGIKHVKGYPR